MRLYRFQSQISHDTMLNWCKNLLRIAGFWPPTSYNGWRRILYYCYTSVSFTLMLGTYIVIQVVDLYLVRGDIGAMTADAFLLFTNLVQGIKIINTVQKREIILGIINNIKDLIGQQTTQREIILINRYAVRGLIEYIFYTILTVIVIMLWIVGPIISNEKEMRSLPLNGWYPYKNEITPAYELTFAHQAIAIFIASHLNVVKDCLASGLINQATCQFALLRLSLENLTDDLTIRYIWSKRGINDNQKDNIKSEKILYEKLKLCIIQHQKILDIVDKIESCFSFVILTQFTVSLIIICVTAFQLLMGGSKNIVQSLGIGVYLLDMIYQVFLYCSHGNELIVQSKEVVVSAYFSNWYNCSPRFKHALRALMTRSARPVKLTAGGFAILSYETFTGILKASYSFFTVLKQIEDPKI